MKRAWMLAIFFLIAASVVHTALLFAQASNLWLEDLKSPDANRRAKAARELGKSSDPSVLPALAAAVTDPSEKVRRAVIVALASIRAPEVLDPLITATRDTEPRVRGLAIQGLVGYYTGETPSSGFTGFWRRTWQQARSRFAEENIRIDPWVNVEPKVTAALIETLNDTRVIETSRQAADALGILVAKVAVPDLVKAAYSTDKDLALEALNALAKIKEPSAGLQLVTLLDAAESEVRPQAAVTVGVLRTGEALPKLQAMWENSPDKGTREKALEGLAYLGSPVSLPVFTKALWSAEGRIRTSAAEGMARAADTSALPELEKAVQVERDGDARLAMQFAITALGKADFFSALVKALSSRLRGDSAQSYLIELTQDQASLARLYPYTSSQDARVRRRLCTVLMFKGDQTSTEHLERLSHDSNGEVATAALGALRAVRTRTSSSAPARTTPGQR